MTDLPAEIESLSEWIDAGFTDYSPGELQSFVIAYKYLQRVACLMLSYADGEISEGRAVELIGVDRVTLRGIKIAALDRALEILRREGAPRAANS